MATKRKISVNKREEVPLPDVPKVKDGEICMRMIYADGQSRDIVGQSMAYCVSQAQKTAIQDGKAFGGPFVLSWERIA